MDMDFRSRMQGGGGGDGFGDLHPTAFNTGESALIVDLDGFEGPLDVLLMLARQAKVDLTKLSILALAEQYIVFITEMKRRRIEVAADYLVMAAWLAYLKSRLLLPKEEEEGPSGEDLAARLAFRLARLEAMRESAAKVFSGFQKGRDFFVRGEPEQATIIKRIDYQCSLYELLTGYAAVRAMPTMTSYEIKQQQVFAIDEAIKRLGNLVSETTDWQELSAFLPPVLEKPEMGRSALASTLVATLELARRGRIEIQQTNVFGPIMVRVRAVPTDDLAGFDGVEPAMVEAGADTDEDSGAGE